MYLKLALRNAKRSMLDYLLYISSMVMLTSIIFLSNCIADWGDGPAQRSGFFFSAAGQINSFIQLLR